MTIIMLIHCYNYSNCFIKHSPLIRVINGYIQVLITKIEELRELL